jgi:hypothetical protein
MGCDIHLHVEVKINGKWEHYNAPDVERHYRLFAKMAGVRNYGNEVQPISLPRGLPTDINAMTKFMSDYEGRDGHNHSWLSSAEVAELIKSRAEWEYPHYDPNSNTGGSDLFGYFFGNCFDDFGSPDSKERLKGVEDFRFVFWFDN